MEESELKDIGSNCETWQKAVERLTNKGIDDSKVTSYFSEKNTQPIDVQTPVGEDFIVNLLSMLQLARISHRHWCSDAIW